MATRVRAVKELLETNGHPQSCFKLSILSLGGTSGERTEERGNQ
jgi:hypothetical protein